MSITLANLVVACLFIPRFTHSQHCGTLNLLSFHFKEYNFEVIDPPLLEIFVKEKD
jgi:hypothetical protein